MKSLPPTSRTVVKPAISVFRAFSGRANRPLGHRALQAEQRGSIVIRIELIGEMRVGVDKARQQGRIPQIDDGGSGRDGPAAHGLNLSIGDHHQPGLNQRAADAVEQPRRFDRVDFRLRVQVRGKTQ